MRGPRIRIRTLLVAGLVVSSLRVVASVGPIILLLEGQRREILPVVRGEADLLPIDQVVSGLGVSVVSDSAGGAVTLAYRGREVSLYDKKSLASVGGDLRLLSAPVVLEDGRWLVPVESIPRLLGPLLGTRSEWRAASRVLILGNVTVPRVTVTTFVTADAARVVLEASEKVPYRVLQEAGRVTITIPRDLLDVGVSQERMTGGIVDSVQFLGGRENLFAVTLGKRFQQLKAFEQENPSRLVMDFQAAPLPTRAPQAPAVPGAPPPAATPRPTPRSDPAEATGPRTIVIDPGHGGEEAGAQGPSGLLEKDVTLSIARKLRAAISNHLGMQVFLTRDRDLAVSLDERTAIANNYKADLFISIHANASRSHGANGSEVYFLSYQASDEESRRVAQAEGGAALPEAAAPGSDLALILWDMAQAEHLEESSALATRIQEELAGVTGSEGRGIKQAPFRVLVGAGMPAVLVEVAFISHPEEEKLLASESHQGRLATALMRGVARYEVERMGRASLAGDPARAGQ
jgi:N-acetylmuramoyl-L-alanine amidase